MEKVVQFREEMKRKAEEVKRKIDDCCEHSAMGHSRKFTEQEEHQHFEKANNLKKGAR